MSALSLFAEPFVLHALITGTAVALLCGAVGYFTVLREQVFAGDAMSHVSYTGAVAALAAGVDLRFGLFAATVAVGVVLGLLGGRRIADDVVIGTTFAWILGLGVLFAAVYARSARGADGSATVTVLFGSIYGLSGEDTVQATVLAVALLTALALVARPLLFASVDPVVAAARGVPVRALGTGFLVLVGLTAAEVTQVVGSILLLGLLAAPAGAAARLTARPRSAVVLSMVFALGSVWTGIVVSVLVSAVPASFGIVAAAASAYGLSMVLGGRSRRRSPRTTTTPPG